MNVGDFIGRKPFIVKWLGSQYVFYVKLEHVQTFIDMFKLSHDPIDLIDQLQFMQVDYIYKELKHES